MKIVLNKCFGGFGLSEEAYKELGIPWDGYGYEFDYDRSNPKLVEVIEKLGDRANGGFAELEVVEIPDDVLWEISNYDGIETIHESHRSW
jgi:hypothetical protein